jgi:hypothetical protein
MRTARAMGAWMCGVVVGIVGGAEHEAAACGGCFVPPPPPTQQVDSSITAERMIFSISKDQTTLYDEITFSGSPSSFAWVLPVKGKVEVGLSADILFATLDSITGVTVVQPYVTCGDSENGFGEFGGAEAGSGSGDAGGGGGPTVSVIAQAQVGPYETVQLHSSDGSALTNWLTSHGYNIPAADGPTITHYVAAGMDFLAMKLVPGAGIREMQPVRVTTPGAFPVLPLRMVSIGTGATTGITLWVVADGRWEPQNFPFFTVEASEIYWNFDTGSSDYETVRLAKEKALGGRGWQIESSLELAKYSIDQALVSNVPYAGATGNYPEEFDAGGQTPSTEDAATEDNAGTEDTLTEDTASEDGFDDAGASDPGGVAAATADLAVLFTGISGSNVRITRMRADVAHSALSDDLVIQAASDQSEITNALTPTRYTGDPCGDAGGGSGFFCDDGAACSPPDAGLGEDLGDDAAGGGGCDTAPSPLHQGGLTWAAVVAYLVAGAFRSLRQRRES